MDNPKVQVKKSEEVHVPLAEALPGMQIVGLPDGDTWVGALMLIKTQDGSSGDPTLPGGWSMRRTEGLVDEELLGLIAVVSEMLRDRIRFRSVRSAGDG